MKCISCKKCQRLTKALTAAKRNHPDYYCKPVPAIGDLLGPLLIVGLAPGYHGANRTGHPFCGDASGRLLFQVLKELELVNHSDAENQYKNLTFFGCAITNAVKCWPPQNKPIAEEIRNCSPFLKTEIEYAQMNGEAVNRVVLSLGQVAHNAVLRVFDVPIKKYPFKHGVEYPLEGRYGRVQMISSYHCSQYNIQTKRLTYSMLYEVIGRAKALAQLT